MEKIKVFGVTIDNITIQLTLDKIDQLISSKHKGIVVTPNIDHVVKLKTDQEFKQIYDQAYLVLNDSTILKRSASLLGHKMKDKISGSDLFPILCEHAVVKNYNVFFLGGMPGVADKAAKNLLERLPTLNIVGTYSPPFGFEHDVDECKKIVQLINDKKPDILFIGLGAPKQEKFAAKFMKDYHAYVSLCIGASFDFQAGSIKRAPVILQKMGLEWFYRFYKEPKRLFKRYFVDDMKFIGIFVKELILSTTKRKNKQ